MSSAGASGSSSTTGGSSGSGHGGTANAGGAGGDPSACVDLNLNVGETGPHGTTPLFKTSSILDIARGLAVVAGEVYFISNQKLQHVPVTGGAAVIVGQFSPAAVVVSGSTLVWFESPVAPATTLRVLSAPITDISKPTVLTEGIAQPSEVSADADTIFFDSRTPDNIYSLPLTGGTPKNLVPGGSPLGMVSDGTNLYWLEFASNMLERVPKAGGAPQNLAEVFFGGPMAVDSTYVYWGDTSDNAIDRWGMGDTMITKLWQTGSLFDSPDSIIVSNSTVYWTQGSFCTALWEIGPNQSTAQMVASGFQEAGVFGVDSTHLYVGATDGIYRVDR